MDHWRTQRGNQKMSRNIWQWKDNDLKPMGHSKSSSKREVDSNTILTQEKKNSEHPTLTPKATRERRTNKTLSY